MKLLCMYLCVCRVSMCHPTHTHRLHVEKVTVKWQYFVRALSVINAYVPSGKKPWKQKDGRRHQTVRKIVMSDVDEMRHD